MSENLQIAEIIEDARRRLVDTGTRNRLIHVNRSRKTGKFLNIINERSDDVFDILRTQGRKMKFHASDTIDDDSDSDTNTADEVLLQEVDLSPEEETVDKSRFTDRLLDTPLGVDALQKRLLQLARDAKTAEEEQGINILYLALGFLTWYEDENSNTRREAPLILIPVDLVRNQRSSTYDLQARDDDIATNLPFQERIKNDFGMTLPEIEEGEDFTPSDYFEQVRDVCTTKPRWQIDDNGIQLGFFSFAKQLMQHDLEQANWPAGSLGENETMQNLLLNGFEPTDPLFGPDEKLDGRLEPADIVQVVDADVSQTKVIEEVRKGRNLVVQGPPGTGKSQTITNIIAAAAHDGKTVLFMAEKMAALSVVHKRLEKVRLGDLCLELHSRKANKKAVVQELGRTLRAAGNTPHVPPPPDELRAKRDELNRIAALLHSNINGYDFSPFDAMAEIIGFTGWGKSPPDLPQEGLDRLTNEKRQEINRTIRELARVLEKSGSRAMHPFAGTRAFDLQPTDIQRLDSELRIAVASIDAALTNNTTTFSTLGLSSVRCLKDLDSDLRILELLGNPTGSEASKQHILELLRNTPERAMELGRLIFSKEPSNLVAERLQKAGPIWTAAKQDEEAAQRDLVVAKQNRKAAGRECNAAQRDLIAAEKECSEIKQGSQFYDQAWTTPLEHLRVTIKGGTGSGIWPFFKRLGNRYRVASKTLEQLIQGEFPQVAEGRLALLDKLAKAQSKLDQAQSNLAKAQSKLDQAQNRFDPAQSKLEQAQLRLDRVQSRCRLLDEDRAWLETLLGDVWQGEHTDFAGLTRAATWLGEVEATRLIPTLDGLERLLRTVSKLQSIAPELADLGEKTTNAIQKVVERLRLDLEAIGLTKELVTIPLTDLQKRLVTIHAGLDRYGEWAQLGNVTETIRGYGLDALITAIDAGDLAPTDATDEFNYACAEARWRQAQRRIPGLAELTHLDRHRLVKVFHELESNRLTDIQTLLRSQHLAQLPQGAAGEMGIILGEIGRKRKHMPIRKLIDRAGTMVQRIKPLFLMSPISIAQFLPPGSLTFDLLVVDEASQVRPEDALGAIARVRQIVVVGDQKQLPPTSFFERLGGNDSDEEEDEPLSTTRATEMESILTLCEARGLGRRMLEWHYRSKDPSLICVSNSEFYENRLVLPPSPLELDEHYGLSFHKVPGVYSSKSRGGGRAGTNRIEAEKIAAVVAHHACTCPGLSLGIVTFSKAQSDMVTEVLEYARRQDRVLNEFLSETHAEDVFVKNIENVQGDERDVILISVGYGPHEAGSRLASMNFGPINGEGGERRLNVLFTRARARCQVFASFDPGDMNLAKTSRDGPRVLKRFLEFAQTGQMNERTTTDGGPDSPFEEDVAQMISSLGYLADHQVGSAGFRIDVGVRHPDRPGQYILAVECDGAAYHSALSARERDRQRQDVLEGLGWTFHRIWSTDWFHRRAQEVERLKSALEDAYRRVIVGIRVPGANDEDGTGAAPANSGENMPVLDVSLEHASERPEITVPAYERADSTVSTFLEPHEMPLKELVEIVQGIVKIEGPVHVDEVARRLATVLGKRRTGTRISTAARQALRDAQANHHGEEHLQCSGDFWFTVAQSKNVPVRDRSGESGPTLQAAALPPMEVRAAATMLEKECGQMDRTEMVREIGRLLGFKRIGADLQRTINSALGAD
ncbi:MAG: DUF3320 domain-containing protein [Desulfurellaceae bacterium]|nr:DUF3320 domain-containing protein [Desulfurellaceae bacterium]